jgi:hypothetical protein
MRKSLMGRSGGKIEVALEIGKKKTFASAIEWPGWSRSGRDESLALQTLFEYGARYARALRPAGSEFQPPADASALVVVERLEGNATTDFGAPGIAPTSDNRPVDDDELQQFKAMLDAFWRTFNDAVAAAAGKELRKGPRGGGRDLEGIVQHVLAAEIAYLKRLGGSFTSNPKGKTEEEIHRIRQAVSNTLAAAAHGELPPRGPRGGARWTSRYFVRRSAWHVLDHVWEIEDRVIMGN